MTKEWIPAIYDRTYGHVQDVALNPDQKNPKGCWNAVDLNRIENNIAYCAEYMYEQKIVHTPIAIVGPSFEKWTGDMIPTKVEIDRILNNARLLVELSRNNPAIANELPTIYAATQINYILANDIEHALELIHTQPKLPLEYFEVKINNGVILNVLRTDGSTEQIGSNTALVAEDEIVTIRGVEYGEYSQYQTFTYWSGQAEDIGLLDNYEIQQTFFTMPYRNLELTANFETNILRTLTITNGYISTNKDPTAESGPSTSTYLAGEEIMIIANVAPSGKAFYEWLGTKQALDNIVGVTSAEDPSTAILTMPDCDVTLEPHFINAGQHRVTVTNGTGGGLYNYKDRVSISATIPNHYGFDSWSGDTSYLSDIYSSYQSFEMGDMNISFRANYSYRYSYNDVQVINGLIRVNNQNVDKATGLKESNSYTLIPTPPDASQGIDYWSVEGLGNASLTTFTVGDGNAIITGHYAPLQTLTVTNRNNTGGTETYSIVQGHTQTLTTNSVVGNYKFNGWYEGSTRLSTSTTYTVTMGTSNKTVEARYDYYETYTVTLINKNNNGQTNTFQVLSGEYWSTSTNEEVGDYLLVGWYKNNTQVSTSISYGFYVSADTTLTIEYRLKETYHLTVNNGTGSGDYKERQSVTITADDGDFSHWTYSDLYSIGSSTSKTTTVRLGRSDGIVTANYNMRTITIIKNSGTTTTNIIEDNSAAIDSGIAPDTYEFNHWEITEGDATVANQYSSSTRVTAHKQDSTIKAIYTPIPRFTVTMIDGYVWDGTDWVTSATLLRNSTNAIKMKPAPTGHQFLQWEVYENDILQTDANDVYSPLAETTTLRNLLRDITIKATYYIPDPTVTYTLSIERKDGTIEQNNYAVGVDVPISASFPDQGMEFYKWTGDTAYISGGIYEADSAVRMPAQNITITENFVPEGYIPEYEVVMYNQYGKCCYETTSEDPETHEQITTEHWVTRHSYPEGTTVKIKAEGWDAEYKFNYWKAYKRVLEQNGDEVSEIIDDLYNKETTITVPAYDINIDPGVALKDTYKVLVNGGGTSGDYYEGKRVDIYFNVEDPTDNIRYEFKRWVKGPTSEIELYNLELYDGGMFNVLTPGTLAVPQYIKMPAKRVELTATYDTLYKLHITNGTINSTGTSTEYYIPNITLNITADPAPTGMRFQYWEGDTDHLGSKYDPTTTVTTVSGVTVLTAIYSTDTERNSVGYVNNDLKSTTTINNETITMISGETETGTILTDSNGHIYAITSIDSSTNMSTIYRLTKITQGGSIYG